MESHKFSNSYVVRIMKNYPIILCITIIFTITNNPNSERLSDWGCLMIVFFVCHSNKSEDKYRSPLSGAIHSTFASEGNFLAISAAKNADAADDAPTNIPS